MAYRFRVSNDSDAQAVQTRLSCSQSENQMLFRVWAQLETAKTSNAAARGRRYGEGATRHAGVDKDQRLS